MNIRGVVADMKRKVAGGLLLSTTADLPSGPMIVWVLVALAVVVEVFTHRRAESEPVGQ